MSTSAGLCVLTNIAKLGSANRYYNESSDSDSDVVITSVEPSQTNKQPNIHPQKVKAIDTRKSPIK